jgi:hypothetical protein
MAISRKPNTIDKEKDLLIDRIIEKGGASPTQNKEINEEDNKSPKSIKLTIRLPQKMINIIDAYLKDSLEQTARTHWIKEAITEKINKDITKQN